MRIGGRRKNVQIKRARRQPAAVLSSVQPEEKPLDTVVSLDLSDGEDDAPRDFKPEVLELFQPSEFYAAWKNASVESFKEAMQVVAELYAFVDVLSSFEEALRINGIDGSAQLLDDGLHGEIEAMMNYRLLLLFANRIFSVDDYAQVRNFLLQPENKTVLDKLRSDKGNPSDLIRQMYEMQKQGASNVEKLVDRVIKPAQGEAKTPPGVNYKMRRAKDPR